MRILSLGAFTDYRIQLANALSKTETVMLVLPKNRWFMEDKFVDKNKIYDKGGSGVWR